MKTADEAADRCLDQALREECGGERTPDLTAAVRARAAIGDWPDELREVPAPRRWFALFAAAGIVVAAGTAVLVRRQPLPAVVPAGASQDPAPTATKPVAAQPEWTSVTHVAEIATLSESCTALRLAQWDEGDGTKSGIAAALDRTPRLQRLDLGVGSDDGTVLVAADLKRIGEQTSLRELHLAGRSEIEPAWLASLAALPSLTTLSLSAVPIGDEGAAAIARFPSLQSLELAFDGTLTDAGLAHLATLPGLRHLSLHGCGHLTSSGFRLLAACTRIERLDLRYCSGVGDGARRGAFRGLPPTARRNFEVMLAAELVLAAKPGGGVDDAVLASLAALPGLRELLLTGCPSITPKGVAAIARLPLRRLAVSIRSTDAREFVAVLPPTLEELSLAWSTGLDDEAAAGIGKQLPQLRKLDLYQCSKLTDDGFARLLADTALTELELRGCSLLTAAALPALLAARSLEVLDVSGHAWLDDDVEKKLKSMSKMRDLRSVRRTGGGLMLPK